MTNDLVKQIREIPWDTLNAEQAREVFAALRVGVEAGAAWFAKFAEAFGTKAPSAPMVRAQTEPSAEAPKRPRGRPKKASPADREGVESSPHPPVGILNGAYVSQNGPDLSRGYSLPVGHPRASGGSGVPEVGDADFVAASRAKPEFN